MCVPLDFQKQQFVGSQRRARPPVRQAQRLCLTSPSAVTVGQSVYSIELSWRISGQQAEAPCWLNSSVAISSPIVPYSPGAFGL